MPGLSIPLNAVWGSGADDVWAVGGDTSSAVLHWDGSRSSNVPTAANSVLNGVWGTNCGDVWMVGGFDDSIAALLHWDGTAWSCDASPSPVALHGIYGVGTNDVWAVGGTLNDGSAAILRLQP